MDALTLHAALTLIRALTLTHPGVYLYFSNSDSLLYMLTLAILLLTVTLMITMSLYDSLVFRLTITITCPSTLTRLLLLLSRLLFPIR